MPSLSAAAAACPMLTDSIEVAAPAEWENIKLGPTSEEAEEVFDLNKWPEGNSSLVRFSLSSSGSNLSDEGNE